MSLYVTRWTVDYGDGRTREVRIPHAWKQEVDVDWEGPVVYTTLLDIPRDHCWLVFHGVSYEATVSIEGESVLRHEGIWDRFEVDLSRWRGKRISVSVSVVKNGGETFPVNEVLSGFMPYVFQSFGGIFRDVEMLRDEEMRSRHRVLSSLKRENRVRVSNHQIFVDGKPFYMRGILHWGWYPELGHCHPSESAIRQEVVRIKELGFNTVKFCLWIPPHQYLDILDENEMYAWVELPLWAPHSKMFETTRAEMELETIVRQYARHDNIVAWSVGCELTDAPVEFRSRMVNKIASLTGCPLVKDSSGGAEMYGLNPKEFGSFDDFHPYCDGVFYPETLDSLLPGPRPRKPILLGEWNDYDVHRDVAQLANQMPFWTSSLNELNAKGVRWLFELPKVVSGNRFAQNPAVSDHDSLMEISRQKGLFVRKFAQEELRARDAYQGYVVTGLRDTPISSAGIFDDWMNPRFSSEELSKWNQESCLFMIPGRKPPWISGGNRAGYLDRWNVFEGNQLWKIGIHSERGLTSGLIWKLLDEGEKIIFEGAEPSFEVPPLHSIQVAEIFVPNLAPGRYTLSAEFGGAANEWTIQVTTPLEGLITRGDQPNLIGVVADRCVVWNEWNEVAQAELEAGEPQIIVMDRNWVIRRPFWRECVNEPTGYAVLDNFTYNLGFSTDRVIDPHYLRELEGDFEVVLNRVDTRTYKEHAYVVRWKNTILTTLRPQGGTGIQPEGLQANPAGHALVRCLMGILES